MEPSEAGGALHSLYRRYIGPVQDSRDVYAGFGLFFTGVGLIVVAIVVFLWSTTVPPNESFAYTLREFAAVPGAVGLPLVLLGVTVLLPVSRRIDAVAAAGVAVCLAGVVRFVQIYPQTWYTYSSTVVGLYALGAVVVVATAGTALSGYHIERAAVRTEADLSGEAATDETDAESADGSAVTDEQVREDIESAMDGAEMNWGGVERDSGQTLTLTDTSVDDADDVGLANASATESRGGSVDDAVAGLQNLRGGQQNTATSEGDTAEQATALAELRAKQRERDQEDREEESDGVLGRLRSLFS